MCRGDLIAFNNVSQLPARNDIGDAAVLLNTANDDLGHELAITAHQHFTVIQYALVSADVQHHKIPLGIHGDDFALQISAQRDDIEFVPINSLI